MSVPSRFVESIHVLHLKGEATPMKKLILLFAICLLGKLNAQDFKLVSATSQGWAGGVCCRSGTNYVISFSTTDTVTDFTIDTLWVDDNCFVVDKKNSYFFSEVKFKGKRTFTIHAGISSNGRGDINYDEKIEEKKIVSKKPEVKGRACVSYHTKKNKQRYFVVEELKQLEFLAYP